MLKCELEKQLGKVLTNQEYMTYMHKEFLKKKGITKTVKKPIKKEIIKINTFNFKDVKEEFLNTLQKQSDINYYKKEYEFVLKFDNYFLLFQKPDIKTHFCFGYGLNGVSTQEEFESALDNEKHINSSESAFINENLEGINENIFDYEYLLKDYDEQYKLYTNPNGCYRYSDLIGKKVYIINNSYLNQCYIRFYASYDFDNMMDYEKKNIIRELTKEEIQEILEVYKKQKENFMKRLNTYLKKYGLSKLHTWTYLVD